MRRCRCHCSAKGSSPSSAQIPQFGKHDTVTEDGSEPSFVPKCFEFPEPEGLEEILASLLDCAAPVERPGNSDVRHI